VNFVPADSSTYQMHFVSSAPRLAGLLPAFSGGLHV
jgi:hypothetical protein